MEDIERVVAEEEGSEDLLGLGVGVGLGLGVGLGCGLGLEGGEHMLRARDGAHLDRVWARARVKVRARARARARARVRVRVRAPRSTG